MATNWRRKWVLGGWTPYYYFYPDNLDGKKGVLRDSEYTPLLGWISVFLWVLFLVSFISWWMVDWLWLYVVWIVLLVGIFVEWGVVYRIALYMETEAKRDQMNIGNKKEVSSNNKKEVSSKNTTPMKMKTTVQLKSLKMQL